MIKRIRSLKIRTKLLLLLLLAGLFCLLNFSLLWNARNRVWVLASSIPSVSFGTYSDSSFFQKLYAEALKYEIPSSEKDTEAVKKLEPFLNLGDDYTGIYIYGIEDGLYRAGSYPKIMDNSLFSSFFGLGYRITNGTGEETNQIPVKFKNGYATVFLTFYHRARFFYVYYFLCFFFNVFLFLAVILFFVSRKVKDVLRLEKEVCLMSSGDLSHPVDVRSGDETGSLAQNLDQLRQALSVTIRQEQESRTANQDLITAMSHDLRTPLTILNGYLEILRLGKNPALHDEYLGRCLRKTAEIREMTDRMFEYALVFEETESVKSCLLPLEDLLSGLMENSDYIRLTGFSPEISFPGESSGDIFVCCDPAMVKRIFSNLFSNIIKYGEKKEPVAITGSLVNHFIVIELSNTIRTEYVLTNSSRIGLKNVRQMVSLMGGSFSCETAKNHFTAKLSLPLSNPPDSSP